MESLFDSSSYRRAKLFDFEGIPGRIWPTPVYLLHQGTDVLVYRNTDAARGISRAQNRLFSALARMGDSPDAPGSIQVVVCTGQEGVVYDRQMAVYDHMRNDEKLRLAQPGEIPGYVASWFHAREGR
jgi:hypothetical protein